MIGSPESKKSLDKPKKKEYKENSREDSLQSFILPEVPPPIVTRKDIKDAIRFLDRAKRKLKKVLDRA